MKRTRERLASERMQQGPRSEACGTTRTHAHQSEIPRRACETMRCMQSRAPRAGGEGWHARMRLACKAQASVACWRWCSVRTIGTHLVPADWVLACEPTHLALDALARPIALGARRDVFSELRLLHRIRSSSAT